uniref:Uncharacterized protein n=1 Tax=Rhizophora mucronata TaxID=61149 RepID=A0A2P2QDV9_RHIMU
MLLCISLSYASVTMLVLSRMRCFLCQRLHFLLLDFWRLLEQQLEWQLQLFFLALQFQFCLRLFLCGRFSFQSFFLEGDIRSISCLDASLLPLA